MKTNRGFLVVLAVTALFSTLTLVTPAQQGTPINFSLDRVSARYFSNTGTLVANFTTRGDQDVDHYRILYAYYSPDALLEPFTEAVPSAKQVFSTYSASDFVAAGPADLLFVRIEVTFEDGRTYLSDPVVALRSRPLKEGGKLQ